MFNKMVSMERAPAEVAEDVAKTMAVSAKPSGPKYPWGLCISLDNETLKKLGIDGDLPSIGETIHFSAIAKVTSASLNENEGVDGSTEQCRRIELQITDMGVPDPEPKRNWYAPAGDNDNDD